MNWKDRYNKLESGTKVKITKILGGNWDEVSWNEGDILTLGKFVKTEKNHGDLYETEEYDEIYRKEFEVYK